MNANELDKAIKWFEDWIFSPSAGTHGLGGDDWEDIKLVIDAAKQHQQYKWRPISEAPRDGELFLESDGKSVFITRPAKDNLLRNTCNYINPHANLTPSKKPKYWMPLPSPPKGE